MKPDTIPDTRQNMMDSQIKYKKIAYLGLFTALALIFSYVESLLPINFGLPGIKLGIANVVTVLIIYIYSYKEALIVSIARIVISAFLFTNAFSLLYSLAGALFSIAVMTIIKKWDQLSIVGVSIAGGVFHNIGQLIIATLIVKQIKITYYAPILIVSGVITGLLVGLIAGFIYKRVETYVRL